jgi:DNA modification methylase
MTEKEKLKKQKEEEKNRKKFRETNIYGDTMHRIIAGDAKKMNKIKKEEVDLIITSPPYFNAKDYIQYESLIDYLKDMRKAFKECLRVLKPGRRFCLNISDLPTKGESGVKWITLGTQLLNEAEKAGFELADRIFWFKTPLKGFNYGSLPYPPSPLIADSIEYVYVLRKPGKPDYKYLDRQKREASKLSREEYMEYTKQVWSIRRVRTKDNVDGHIAPFPEEIPLRCIRLYSFVGDTILDPFGGSGTTTKVAADFKRNSVLYEIKPEYIKIIKDRMKIEGQNLYTNPEFIYE